MMCLSDYPTDEALEFIKDYELGKQGPGGMLAHLKSLWHWSDMFCTTQEVIAQSDGKTMLKTYLELHTGGWSGNEDIITALEGTVFWLMYWEKSQRGGHYFFEIPEFK